MAFVLSRCVSSFVVFLSLSVFSLFIFFFSRSFTSSLYSSYSHLLSQPSLLSDEQKTPTRSTEISPLQSTFHPLDAEKTQNFKVADGLTDSSDEAVKSSGSRAGEDGGRKGVDPDPKISPKTQREREIPFAPVNSSNVTVGNEVEENLEMNYRTREIGTKIGGELSLKELNLGRKCDLYSGKWVKDEGYPLYQMGSCPYIDEAFSCYDNGRFDSEYTKWRWKPHDCDIPRFNGTDFLEGLRGKRLILIGDSMNRNQFESLLCLLYESLLDKSKMYETRGNKISKGRGYFVFKFKDYDCTVEFSRSHYLTKEGTRLISPGRTRPILSIDRIDKRAKRWKHADILIFNTGHWWAHGKTLKGKDFYKEGDAIYHQFNPVEAYRRAMKTWGKWIDDNINSSKTLVFYRGYSSAHFRGGDWDSGGTCNGEKEPIMNGAFINNYPLKMRIIEEVIHEMKFPVILLNVTRLTNFRKDGHPSIYRKRNLEVSSRRQDCSHWCLPGVPDAWNELIYASLFL